MISCVARSSYSADWAQPSRPSSGPSQFCEMFLRFSILWIVNVSSTSTSQFCEMFLGFSVLWIVNFSSTSTSQFCEMFLGFSVLWIVNFSSTSISQFCEMFFLVLNFVKCECFFFCILLFIEVGAIAKLLLKNKCEHDKTAAEWTERWSSSSASASALASTS